jgi:hypothetical protein
MAETLLVQKYRTFWTKRTKSNEETVPLKWLGLTNIDTTLSPSVHFQLHVSANNNSYITLHTHSLSVFVPPFQTNILILGFSFLLLQLSSLISSSVSSALSSDSHMHSLLFFFILWKCMVRILKLFVSFFNFGESKWS